MTTLNPFAIVGAILRAITPKIVLNAIEPWLDRIRGLLTSSPARVIGYGAAVVIYLVALAFDRIPDMTFEQALVNTTFAITTLVGVIEAIRHYVFSPATVAKMVAAPPTAAGPIAAAVAEGVDPALIADAVIESDPGAPAEPTIDTAAVLEHLDELADADEEG